MEAKETRRYAIALSQIWLMICVFCGGLWAQPIVVEAPPTDQLVRGVLFNGDNSLRAFNFNYSGDRRALGVFNNNDFTDQLWPKAIVISTGLAYTAASRNLSEGTGKFMRSKGHPDLARIAKNASFDAAILEFDFRTDYDSIYFEYFFASEEYPEFVNRGVNDVFGFFIREEGTSEWINLAKVPTTGEAITIDNVNGYKNKEYYRSNRIYALSDYTELDIPKEAIELSYSLCFDGMTTPLVAGLRVKPGATYRFRIAISDIGDGAYDSAVFLRAGSFKATKAKGGSSEPKVPDEFSSLMKEVPGLTYDKGSIYLNIRFPFDSSELPESEKERLQVFVKQLYAMDYSSLAIRGHTDAKGTVLYNRQLSLNRANKVKDYMASLGLSQMNMSVEGVGELEPIADNETAEGQAKNRRVEFVFKWD